MEKVDFNKTSIKIQMLRGLAIIAVVIGHTAPIGIVQAWYRPFINFAVGLFLFLSGMLSNVERWKPKKRIIKVIIPYAIWTLVYVILNNSYDSIIHLPVSYIKSFISTNSAAMMYYIFIYCEFTLLIPLIDKLAKSKFKWIGFLITPIEMILMRLIPLIIGYDINDNIEMLMEISCLGWFVYFYIGYLIGNNYLTIKMSTIKLNLLWACSIILQMAEGYWYYSMGEENCGTQMKLSAVISGVLFVILAYRYIYSEKTPTNKVLKILGDYSFGIYFSHILVMRLLYKNIKMIFPIDTISVLVISLLFVFVGRKVLGRYAKYLAF